MQTRQARSARHMVLATTLCLVSALAITGLAYLLRPGPVPGPASAPPKRLTSLKLPEGLFRGWKKPDLAILTSGQQYGYLLPCGCSRPQYGGLERRHNLLQVLRSEGWPVTAVDVGDVPQDRGIRDMPNVQGLIKYRVAMESMKDMGYLAVSLGEREAALNLFTVLAEFALNNPTPRVLAGNVKDRDSLFPEQLYAWKVSPVPDSSLRVGVFAVISPTVQKKIKDEKIKFEDNRLAIPRILREMEAEKPDFRVLLYQGQANEARTLAGDHKSLNLIVCLSDTDEPSAEPIKVGDTLIVSSGHKGRHVGVVGAWKTGHRDRPFELKYQLVSLGEEFMTPDDERKDHPILRRMEDYTRELQKQNYLAKVSPVKHPMQLRFNNATPIFVGSDACKKCHSDAYDVWKESKHAHAYETLVKVKHPGLRQHDPECIVCHTVGFGYESGFRSERETPKLKDVGCESCHGPGSEHVKNPKDTRWYAEMNPWRAKENETEQEKARRILKMDQFCQTCHDVDNDVKWKFDLRWPPIKH